MQQAKALFNAMFNTTQQPTNCVSRQQLCASHTFCNISLLARMIIAACGAISVFSFSKKKTP